MHERSPLLSSQQKSTSCMVFALSSPLKLLVPQRTQVAAWGLDANIAELKDAVSQV
jgi:hypothetical protein